MEAPTTLQVRHPSPQNPKGNISNTSGFSLTPSWAENFIKSSRNRCLSTMKGEQNLTTSDCFRLSTISKSQSWLALNCRFLPSRILARGHDCNPGNSPGTEQQKHHETLVAVLGLKFQQQTPIIAKTATRNRAPAATQLWPQDIHKGSLQQLGWSNI
ncbi:hypothetical protein Nepgr_005282 [Nepenthes gracilis]|uniref:Uncharacterized protein n=1 Tax=Nepenthes gracilis TaxID=150966 RepID=A0AAD3S302_NEPGR|nr:hypothetical protein Nepgr_005282 [Nepenthes gracilis]